jgi:hypothetical protein
VSAGRLVQWDPFEIRVDAEAATALLRERLGEVKVKFGEGAIEVAMPSPLGPIDGRLTIASASGHVVRLRIDSKDLLAADISISLTRFLPSFVDVAIAGAQIREDGLLISLAAGGADAPPLK